MEMLRLLLLGSAALAPVAAGVGLRPDIGQLGKALDAHYEPNKLWQRANPPADDGKDLVFETIVHYCCEREQDCPTEGDIRLTIETLNEYFSRAKIRFEFQKAVHQSDCGLDPANHDQDAIDRLMARVREGGLDVYNIMIRAGPEAERIGGTCYTPTPGRSTALARALGIAPAEETKRLHLFWSCEQIRILRQWGNIRKHGQEDGFGITHDAADPPPRGPAGTYCPGAGGSDGGAGGSGGDAGNTDGQSSGEGGGAPASGSPPGGAGCKNPDFKIPPPPAGYGSWRPNRWIVDVPRPRSASADSEMQL
ncbi:hypothetical protein VFPBJ_03897 [Purpureocillium lilacinum]|uniref:Uncharacterized protein n=1 Tax=Purpureocillium lilacinum TaxID=33203 RepID=A0A179H4L5_PURLI|nr:hypothetical protein VFPBJ_03897 [Purpureocillium lilacinum]